MAIYLYFNEDASANQEKEAIKVLESLGYTELEASRGSYINHGTIISLGLDQHLIQLNFNDVPEYLTEFQRILDECRRIFTISNYQIDFDMPIEKGLSLEGLVRKE
ncbi:MAG: hypothetical protein Q8R18_02330 [bacterium]|nr:hypothetical protein [bacterium]